MWYDLFSFVYDSALEDLYAPFRQEVANALGVVEGSVVLDVPCGTGQSLDTVIPLIGHSGKVLGIDASAGMLNKARQRVERAGWDNVTLHRGAVASITPSLVQTHLGVPQVDAVLCALGLTAFNNWEQTVQDLMTCLRPGGRFVVFDVFASTRTLQTVSVEMVARADLSRQLWPVLQMHCPDMTRTLLPSDPKTFGGELYIASGTRPTDGFQEPL